MLVTDVEFISIETDATGNSILATWTETLPFEGLNNAILSYQELCERAAANENHELHTFTFDAFTGPLYRA